MIEILGTEIDREELKGLMENIAPWDCMYSPETLVDIYIRSGPDSTRLKAALGDDWLENDLVYVTVQEYQYSDRASEEETLFDKKILADAGFVLDETDEIDFEDGWYPANHL